MPLGRMVVTMEPSTRTLALPDATSRGRVFLPELQALRTLAVMLVVLYHLWPSYLQGGYIGVDVFFVISGYLISAHIIRGVTGGTRFSLTAFYVRRIRRLLPAALAVLAVVAIATALWAPQTTWNDTGEQVVASAFYVENWALLFNAVDYLGAAADSSPVQHYWSLSVEEQFYLFWPVLIMLGWWLVRRFARRPRRELLMISTGLLLALSLAYSIWATYDDQATAYFNSLTRVWEFAAGASLAVLLPSLRIPRGVAIALGWLGLAAITMAAVLFTGGSPFPGWIALLPVLGTVAVIAGGSVDGPASLAPVMRLRPVQWAGDISYSIYLWHWPLIVLVPVILRHPLDTPLKVAVLVASLAIAWASKVFIEDPLRDGPLPWRRTAASPRKRQVFVAALAGMVVVSLLGGAMWAASETRIAAGTAALDAIGDPLTVPCLGAAALAASASCTDDATAKVVPDPLIARRSLSGENCQQNGGSVAVLRCTFGDESAGLKVALAGDSHASQWLGPLKLVAARNGWRLETYLRSGCFLQELPDSANGSDQRCATWNRAVEKDLVAGHYDVLLVSARSSVIGGGPKTVEQQQADATRMRAAWGKVVGAGTEVIVIRDIPQPANDGVYDAPTCVLEHADAYERCVTSEKGSLVPDPQLAAAKDLHGVAVLDATNSFCQDGRCPIVIGGVLVYGDGNHMTGLYAQTLAPALDALLQTRLAELGITPKV